MRTVRVLLCEIWYASCAERDRNLSCSVVPHHTTPGAILQLRFLFLSLSLSISFCLSPHPLSTYSAPHLSTSTSHFHSFSYSLPFPFPLSLSPFLSLYLSPLFSLWLLFTSIIIVVIPSSHRLFYGACTAETFIAIVVIVVSATH